MEILDHTKIQKETDKGKDAKPKAHGGGKFQGGNK